MKITFAIIGLLLISACAPNYSDGSRIGVVTKLSRKGLMFKSWEGSMNQGGQRANANGGVSVDTFDFNVDDPHVIAQIQEAQRTGKTVELVYRQWAISPPTIENAHVIIAVRPVQ